MFERLLRQFETSPIAAGEMPEPPDLTRRGRIDRSKSIRVRPARLKPAARCSSSKCPPLFYLVARGK